MELGVTFPPGLTPGNGFIAIGAKVLKSLALQVDSKVLNIGPVEKHEVTKGRKVRFVGPKGIAPLTAEPSQHLLTDCGGQIVMGPSEDVWCYPDTPELDMVWVAFADDIRPIRSVSAAWLETLGEDPVLQKSQGQAKESNVEFKYGRRLWLLQAGFKQFNQG